MRDDPTVVELVERARSGDRTAWDQMVDRYATLVWSVCRRYDLTGPDADDAWAAVWLRIVEKLPTLHEPAALPGWIATIARNECLYLLRSARRQIPVSEDRLPVEPSDDPASDDALLRDERQTALRAAFAQLPDHCRALLSMLFDDPPVPYAEISAKLDMAVGSIGPTRQRCLAHLRTIPEIAALLDRPVPGRKG